MITKRILHLAVTALLAAASASALTACSSVPDSRSELYNEDLIVNWTDVRVTGEHEITVTVTLGAPTCYGYRVVTAETPEEIRIGVITGALKDAPEICAAIAVQQDIKVNTNGLAKDLKILPAEIKDVTLNK